MTLKIFGSSFFAFVFGIALLAAATPAVIAQDDRADPFTSESYTSPAGKLSIWIRRDDGGFTSTKRP